jgi:hypothetical protein
MKKGQSTAATCMGYWRVREHLLLPQNLYDSAQGSDIPFNISGMSPLSLHSKGVSLLLHKAATGYKIRFKSQEFSTFLTTDDENLKHYPHLFPDIEVFYHPVFIYELKTFFFQNS